MNTNINLKISFSGFVKSRYFTIGLAIAVIVIIVFEVFSIKSTFDLLTSASTDVPFVKTTPVVRINFNAYDTVIKKTQRENVPGAPVPVKNPFAQ